MQKGKRVADTVYHDTHRTVPALAVLRDVQVGVDVLQVPVEALALQPVPQQHPLGDVPVRLL